MTYLNQSFAPLDQRIGFTFNAVNVLADTWINCWDGQHPLLDIGCGNCMNSRQAAAAGANVVATELNQSVIPQLEQENKELNIQFSYLHLPDNVPFKNYSFSGILCSEVFHFLDHDEVLSTIKQLFDLLISGGKALITCASEELALLQPFGLKAHKIQQQENDTNCMKALNNYMDILRAARDMESPDHPAWEIYKANVAAHVFGSYFNFFNPEQLASAFEQQGFIIESITLGAADHYPIWKHGEQDQVRLVARKPEAETNFA